MASSLVPASQEKDLAFLQSYLKNTPYKNFLKSHQGDTIQNLFQTIKTASEKEAQSGGKQPKAIDKIKYGGAYALKRDFLSRYACRLALKKAALDKKLFFDALVIDKLQIGG